MPAVDFMAGQDRFCRGRRLSHLDFENLRRNRRLLLQGFVAVISFPSPHSAGRWGRRLGRWAWTVLSRDRLRAMSQLSRLDPALSSATRTSLALKNFLHLGEVLATGCSLALKQWVSDSQ